MLFFTYDLAEYRDQLRGFYFDFEDVRARAVAVHLDGGHRGARRPRSGRRRSKAAYAAFTARFCPLDDGQAASRACDRIFGG